MFPTAYCESESSVNDEVSLIKLYVWEVLSTTVFPDFARFQPFARREQPQKIQKVEKKKDIKTIHNYYSHYKEVRELHRFVYSGNYVNPS